MSASWRPLVRGITRSVSRMCIGAWLARLGAAERQRSPLAFEWQVVAGTVSWPRILILDAAHVGNHRPTGNLSPIDRISAHC